MQDSITTVHSKDVMYGFIICDYKNLNMKKIKDTSLTIGKHYEG